LTIDMAKNNMKRLMIWAAGFALLFLFNVLVEAIVLPMLDMNNTDKNDIYFIAWWIVVGLWLLFGLKIIKHIEQKKNEDTQTA